MCVCVALTLGSQQRPASVVEPSNGRPAGVRHTRGQPRSQPLPLRTPSFGRALQPAVCPSLYVCMRVCVCMCTCTGDTMCVRASTDECILCIFPVYTFLQSSSACVRLKKEETQGHISGQRAHRSHAQLKHCCSSMNPARERRRGSRTCLIHCFDLACRLQDLKRTASNRMPQMVKVLL